MPKAPSLSSKSALAARTGGGENRLSLPLPRNCMRSSINVMSDKPPPTPFSSTIPPAYAAASVCSHIHAEVLS